MEIIKEHHERRVGSIENRVTIADLHIECRLIDNVFFDRRLSSYCSREYATRDRDMLLTTSAFEDIAQPQGEILEQVNAATIVRTADDRLARSIMDRHSDKVVSAVYWRPDYSEVEIQLRSNRGHPVFSLTDYEYMLTGFAFSDRLTQLGGAVLHGSALAMDNQGIVFSANSGVGKSTHAKLWKEYFGDDVAIVNDDKPAIRFRDGIPHIYGTPWSGKTDLNTNMRVPLRAIVFIKRADVNRIERLNVRESLFALIEQIERPYYDSGLGLKILERIEQIVATVLVYRLYCNISYEAVELGYEEIIGKRMRI